MANVADEIGRIKNQFVERGPTPDDLAMMLDRIGWHGHSIQQEILRCQRRKILVAGGERAGKSNISGIFGATRTPYGKLFWIVGDDYETCRPEFNYWVEALIRMGAFLNPKRDISTPKVGQAVAITKTGQIIETKTAMDTRKLASKAPDGILMVEAARHDYDSYLKCVGRVAERRGWIMLSGTFEGSLGWYVDLFNDWSSPNNSEGGIAYSMPSWYNTYIYPGGRDDPEILALERTLSRVPGMFEERCGAVPTPPSGLVFREYSPFHHRRDDVKLNRSLPVYLAIDPSSGTNPYSVLACQFERHVHRNEIGEIIAVPDAIDYCNVIDEVYVTGMIAEEVIDECKEREWWAYVRGGAIDVEAPDDKKRWKKLGGVQLHSEKVDQLVGIRRLKTFLYMKRDELGRVIPDSGPHLRISPRVLSLPSEFSKYRRHPIGRDELVYKERPDDNQPNHSIKALWYLLVARYGDVKSSYKFDPVNTWRKKNVNRPLWTSK